MSVTDSLLRPNEILTGGRVKGGIVRAHLQWVRDYHGAAAVERLVAALPADARAEVDGVIATSWCEFATVVRLDRTIEAMFGRGRPLFLRELGRYSADLNLSGAYRMFRSADLHEFFRRSVLLHRQFQDFGTVSYEPAGDTAGSMIHSNYPCFSPVYCHSAIGYYEQAIVVHGAKANLVIESSCQCAGDASCTFELEWE